MATEPVAVVEDDEFSKMFDSLQPKAADAVVVTPAVETPVVETPVVETPVVAVETPVVETPVVTKVETPVVAAPTEPSTRELLEKFTEIVGKQRDPVEPVRREAPTAVALYNDAELAKLATIQKDFPDLYESFELMLRGAITQNNNHTYTEIAKVLSPVNATMEQVSANQMLNELRSAIPDYNTVYQPVIDWVKTQPDYLQKAYVSVIEEGTVHQITDLVGRWRTATGTPAAVVTPKPANDRSEAVKQAALALAPVVSQRTVAVPSEPTSFDDAFATYSATKKP